jgi:hypothetical protein
MSVCLLLKNQITIKNTNSQPQTKHHRYHHYPLIVLHHPRIIQKTQLKIQIIRFYGEILACICEAVSSDAVTALKITSDMKIELIKDNNVLCIYLDTGEKVCTMLDLLLLAFLYEIGVFWNREFVFFNSLFQCLLPSDNVDPKDELAIALGLVNFNKVSLTIRDINFDRIDLNSRLANLFIFFYFDLGKNTNKYIKVLHSK